MTLAETPIATTPAAADPETAVLGALIEHPARLDECPQLTASHFYKPTHAAIYTAIHTAHTTHGELASPRDVNDALMATERGRQLVVGRPLAVFELIELREPERISYRATQIIEAWRIRQAKAAGERYLQILEGPGGLTAARTRLAEDLAALADQADDTGPQQTARMVDGTTFLTAGADQPRAIWGEVDRVLWATGETLILSGPTGVGKTTLAWQIIAGLLGLRTHVLDWPIQPTGHVLYLACDRPAQAAAAGRRIISKDDHDHVAERLTVWKGPPTHDLALHPQTLIELARKAGATAIVIDSLKDVAVGIAKDEVGAALNIALQTCLAEGINILALHHVRKNTTDARGHEPTSTDELFGSTWITAGAGSVINLHGAAGDPVVSLRHLKQPAAEIGPLHIRHDHDTGESYIYHSIDLIRLIRETGVHGVTARATATVLFPKADGKNTNSEIEKARRRLDSLVRDTIAVRRDGMRGQGPNAEPARYFLATHPQLGDDT